MYIVCVEKISLIIAPVALTSYAMFKYVYLQKHAYTRSFCKLELSDFLQKLFLERRIFQESAHAIMIIISEVSLLCNEKTIRF